MEIINLSSFASFCISQDLMKQGQDVSCHKSILHTALSYQILRFFPVTTSTHFVITDNSFSYRSETCNIKHRKTCLLLFSSVVHGSYPPKVTKKVCWRQLRLISSKMNCL